MNCKQLNSIGLEEVLAFLGHLPTHQNEKEAWYISPFGSEFQASFKVDKPKNIWYLFSEGAGGTTTDFIQKYFNISVKKALEWASDQNFFSFHQQTKTLRSHPNYRIDKIMDIAHPNLLSYLHERGLSAKVYPFIKELWFTINNKQFYSVGFKNNSEGWELRNAFYKGALHKKDISVLPFFSNAGSINSNETEKNLPNQKVAVFEGFTDALSFIEMQKSFQGDLLVLNSTTMLKKALTMLDSYSEITLFLDNDPTGRECTAQILKAYPHAKDFSNVYPDHKDLNEYLIAKNSRAHSNSKAEEKTAAEKEHAEKQNECREETNRLKKRVRRRM